MVSFFKRFIKKISFKGRVGLGSFPIQFSRNKKNSKTSRKNGGVHFRVGGPKTLQKVPMRMILGFLAFVFIFMSINMLGIMLFPESRIHFYICLYLGLVVVFSVILFMATFFASYAVRRLHDVGKSGWYLLLPLSSLLGAALIVVLVHHFPLPDPIIIFVKIVLGFINVATQGYTGKLLMQKGQPFTNRYGAPPAPPKKEALD